MEKSIETKPSSTAADYFRNKLAYEMSPYTLNAHIEKDSPAYYVVDVRSKEEFAEGHLPRANSVPLADLPKRLASLPKDKMIITYCGSLTCQLAPTAALQLAEKGYKVMELHGGFKEWKEGGYPVEK
jgi:rhodanese-related sulfurtransferase